jgi:hypothetical protein
MMRVGIARFSLVQHTSTGENIPNGHKFTKWPQNIPNGRKIYQMATKYTKWPQNIPNGRKIYQMAVKLYQHRPLRDPRKLTQIGNFV